MRISQPQNPVSQQQPALVQWVDIAKGIGISLVVIGHVITNEEFAGLRKYIYWFHMPLFFMISGMLYRQKSFVNYAKSRFRQLLIPYCCFLGIFFISFLFGFSRQHNTPLDFILGGSFMGSGVWWFITSLFFTQISAALIIKCTPTKTYLMLIATIMYYFSTMLTVTNTVFMWNTPFMFLKLPWALESVPIALFFYLFGHTLKNHLLSEETLTWPGLAIVICFFCTTVWLDKTGRLSIPFYSILHLRCSYPWSYPGLDIILPLSGFLLVRELSIRLSKVSSIGKIFTSLGLASMLIMYLHGSLSNMAIPLIFTKIGIALVPKALQILFAIFIPLGVYAVLLKFGITRKLFLGIWSESRVAVYTPICSI